MSNNSNNQRRQGRQIAAVCLAVCLVAVLAIAGTYISKRYDTSDRQAAAENGESTVLGSGTDSDSGVTGSGTNHTSGQDQASQETSSGIVLNTNEDTDTGVDEEDAEKEESQEDSENASEQEDTSDDSGRSSAGGTSAQETSSVPQSGLTLGWPMEGKVLMSYSMDKTVYFKTLNQYKYNPAMLISGKVGDEIKASASGTVSSVAVDAQTGTTVTMNIGGGYSLVYGQLKETQVSEGDYLDTGKTIGYLSEPTKYYTEEGANLYYQVLKNGKAVNPMEFLEED